MGRAEDIFAALVAGGRAAVDRFIEDADSEEQFLDFKRSADAASASRLHPKDKANLAKASGFGNSDGGVIVWGVECSPDPSAGDVATAKFPLDRPARFKSWLEGAISGLTVPPHGTVQHHTITEEQGERGFVATLIPKSNHAPHQTVSDKKYYMRAGSDFIPVPHTILAGMFGRRPQPNVFNAYTISPPTLTRPSGLKVTVGVILHNEGPGIAENIFINCTIEHMPGPNCGAKFTNPDNLTWIGRFYFGCKLSLITRDGVRVPPDAEIVPFAIEIGLRPPFDGALTLSGICGCSGAPSYKFEVSLTSGDVRDAVDAYLAGVRLGRPDEELRRHTDGLFRK